MPVDEKRLRKAYKIIKQGSRTGITLESFVWSENGRLVFLTTSFIVITALLMTDAIENAVVGLLFYSALFLAAIPFMSFWTDKEAVIRKLSKKVPEFHPLNLMEAASGRNWSSFKEEVSKWNPEKEYRYSPNIGIRYFVGSSKNVKMVLRRLFRGQAPKSAGMTIVGLAVLVGGIALLCLSGDLGLAGVFMLSVAPALVFYSNVSNEKMLLARAEIQILKRTPGIGEALNDKKTFYRVFSGKNFVSGGFLRELEALAEKKDEKENKDPEGA